MGQCLNENLVIGFGPNIDLGILTYGQVDQFQIGHGPTVWCETPIKVYLRKRILGNKSGTKLFCSKNI